MTSEGLGEMFEGEGEISAHVDGGPKVKVKVITDPLPPIFSSQLFYKSRPIHLLSRFLPNLIIFLWCPPDDEPINAAEEYLAEQYDREIKEFYLEGQEQARVKREGVQHGQLKEYNQPDV